MMKLHGLFSIGGPSRIADDPDPYGALAPSLAIVQGGIAMMHTVELMELAMTASSRLGYQLRQEYLGGAGGGSCEYGGQRYIFIDLALTANEQLDQLLEALREDPALVEMELPTELETMLGVYHRRAA